MTCITNVDWMPPMPRYKPVDRSPRFLPVVLADQIQPGTFEFALDHLVDHELDLSALDAKFCNDEVGASAYDPRVMLKIVLLAYSRGLVSSRSIAHACLHHVQFMAISGDSQPSYTHIAKFVRELKEQIQPLFTVPTRVNEVWSMDFVSDSLANGRRIKSLTVADDFTHECVDIAVDFGISGQYVTRLLDRAAMFRGYPAAVRTDNGPEFTCRAFIAWAQSHGVQHILIQPGRPMQNGYIESFNGKFRDECLNEHWFETLAQTRTAIAAWRQDYNEVRPHSSLGRIPPAEFARNHRTKNHPPPASSKEIK
jgi:putative transposase